MLGKMLPSLGSAYEQRRRSRAAWVIRQLDWDNLEVAMDDDLWTQESVASVLEATSTHDRMLQAVVAGAAGDLHAIHLGARQVADHFARLDQRRGWKTWKEWAIASTERGGKAAHRYAKRLVKAQCDTDAQTHSCQT